MNEITEQIVTYQDVRMNLTIEKDDYGIASYALEKARKDAFLSNPNLNDPLRCMLCLQRVDGTVAGRVMMFPSRFYNGNEIVESSGGSSLEVVGKFRETGIGADLSVFVVSQKYNQILINADFSEEGLATNKALKYTIFSIPKYYYFQHHYLLLNSLGLCGFIGKSLGKLIDWCVSSYRSMVNMICDSLDRYDIKKVSQIPEWVDAIVLNDGHKYMEVHDHKWLQWNLDNMFHNDKGNMNEFFVVRLKGKDVGFFMTKTRRKSIGKYNLEPIYYGGIMEWGTKDENILSEQQLYMLAISSFGKKVDYIVMAIENVSVVKKLRKRLLFRRGNHFITFRDAKKIYKDANKQSLWRLRYGYADSILN